MTTFTLIGLAWEGGWPTNITIGHKTEIEFTKCGFMAMVIFEVFLKSF